LARTKPDEPRRGSPAKRFGRREAVKAVGVVALTGLAGPLRVAGETAAPPPLPGFRPLATGSLPRAFTRGEFAALAELVELILPATDTPGARAAGVHWYLDDAAAVEPRTAEQLKAALARLDERSRAAYGKGFAAAGERERVRVLAAMADENDASFAFVKARVIDAYYKSEAGQMGELEWVGHEFHDSFPGACPHPDPKSHPRPRFRARAAGQGGPR
jgi:hypothetical protein